MQRWWDLIGLVGVVFVTFSMQFFAATSALPATLRLSSRVIAAAEVWRLITYPLAGWGPASPWVLLELLVLYWFAGDIRARLGAAAFWRLLAASTVLAACCAVATDTVVGVGGGGAVPFQLLQGQRVLLAVVVAAFARLRRDATILLFFVVPVPARAIVWIELVLGFVGFLASRDLPGFVGFCVAAGLGWGLSGTTGVRGNGRRLRLRLQAWLLKLRLRRLAGRRGLRVLDGDKGRGSPPMVN